MAARTIYGKTHSENGWPMVDANSCGWTQIPGAEHVTLQIHEGLPLQTMRAWCADYHQYVEPLRDPDSACWTPTNSVASSNHLSGTAMDLNWNSHPFHKRGTFNPGQMAMLRELLEFYEGTIFWGGDWNSPIDEMHWQMGYNTYNNPHTADFVRRKIRADGRSTFRRGDSPSDVYEALVVLAEAIGEPISEAEPLLEDIRIGLLLSECNTPLRIAHWLAQMGHESAGWVATEEYANGDESQDRWRYKGRTWIQITWRSNYEKFGYWCADRGLVTDPLVFVNDPRSLAAARWRAIGPAWYWTETLRETRAYPTCNEAADHDDLVTVTQIINGGTNGLADRQDRYNRAIRLGDRLLAIIQGDDELADPTVLKQIGEIHGALFNQIRSQSIYRNVNEQAKWQLHELVKNDDGMIHQAHVERAARYGNLAELGRIVRVARGEGAVKDQWAINHASAVLDEIERVNPAVIQAYLTWEVEQGLRNR